MQKKILLVALPLLISGLAATPEPVHAAENGGSLDSMWSETDGKSPKQTKLPPLCSVDSLKDSELIKKGGWPGIGPFKQDASTGSASSGKDSQYVDAAKNTLKVESERNKITSAELRLNNQTKNTFLTNVEMSADFLLESLGAKAARISDFNTQLEKARQKLVTCSQNEPLSLSAGSYLVYLHPEVDGVSKDKVTFIIKINGKDASPDVLRAAPPPEKIVEQPVAEPVASKPKPAKKKPQTTPAPVKAPIAEEPAPAATPVKAAVPEEPAQAPVKAVASEEPTPAPVKAMDAEQNTEPVKTASAPVKEVVTATASEPESAPKMAEHPPVKSQPTGTVEEEDTAPVPLATKTPSEDTPAATTTPSSQPSSSSMTSLNFGIETSPAKAPSKLALLPSSSSKPSSPESVESTAAPTPALTPAPNMTPATPAASADTVVSLQDNFRDAINSWQKIKKVAVRQRDTSTLSEVLAGRALKRQSDAIGWLTTNKKYYEMTPKGIEIDKYDEITKGLKYAVYAKVRESSKLIDDATGQVVKDSDDTYNVNYTIEKIAGRWFISDSAIINQAAKSQKTK